MAIATADTNGTGALERRLEIQRSDLMAAAGALAGAGEKRKLTLAEESTLESYLSDAERTDARLEALRRPAPAVVRREPLTYSRARPELSFVLDLAFARQRPGSMERLERHQREMDVELAARRAEGDARFARAVADGLIVPERRALTTTTGAGGYFAPPLWLLDEFSSIGRAGRVLGDLATQMPLPGGVVSVNLPRLTTGAAVATQSDGGTVSQTDLVDAAVTARVCTITGKEDISVQLRDQAGSTGVDRLFFADLLADYNRSLEVALIGGSGTYPVPLGVLSVSGISSVASTTATVPGVLLAAGQAASLAATARGLPPTTLLLHPRRAFWLFSQSDSGSPNNRPFLELGLGADMDDTGGVAGGTQRCGPIIGLPAYMDQAIPTTLGGGTEDRVIALRPSDCLLLEGEPQFMAADEVLSGSLQVRLLLKRYVAWIPHRWPSSIGIVTGAALAAPSGY